jgi:hypothetical protein
VPELDHGKVRFARGYGERFLLAGIGNHAHGEKEKNLLTESKT